MNAKKLREVIRDHRKWWDKEEGGKQAELSGENLHGAKLCRVNLREARMCMADLSNSDLSYSSMTNANLRRANLRGANFSGANLRGADLSLANLYGANLSGVELYKVDLYGAKGIVNAGMDWRGHLFIGVQRDDGWMVKAGCRWFTISEAKDHWKDNQDALCRVAVIEYHATRR